MRSRIFFLMLAPSLALSACSKENISTKVENDSKTTEKVKLTFVQHTFVNFSYDSNNETNGYIFKDDELAKTFLEYDKGYHLSSDDIDGFNSKSLNHVLPDLEGDGYWSFTFFTTSFDKESGFSSNFLEPGKLDKDLTIHFAIYG